MPRCTVSVPWSSVMTMNLPRRGSIRCAVRPVASQRGAVPRSNEARGEARPKRCGGRSNAAQPCARRFRLQEVPAYRSRTSIRISPSSIFTGNVASFTSSSKSFAPVRQSNSQACHGQDHACRAERPRPADRRSGGRCRPARRTRRRRCRSHRFAIRPQPPSPIPAEGPQASRLYESHKFILVTAGVTLQLSGGFLCLGFFRSVLGTIGTRRLNRADPLPGDRADFFLLIETLGFVFSSSRLC